MVSMLGDISVMHMLLHFVRFLRFVLGLGRAMLLMRNTCSHLTSG